ncbi:MAG: glycoside hydrolase family 95-like protein [Chitinophagaceae bacterium]
MKKYIFCLIIFIGSLAAAQPKPAYNLVFDSMATRWDEGIPLGNGWLGALVWKKDNRIRLSLDRVDLWDDRPMPEIDKLKFSWVVEKVKLNQYDSVQQIGDEPYEKYAAPTKIPGAAMEFDCSRFGKVILNKLDLATALSTIKFENGVSFFNYVHASRQTGYFGFENLPAADIYPELMLPAYNGGPTATTSNSVQGQGLERLGYKKGYVTKTATSIRYHQPTWNGHYYEVLVQWKKISSGHIIGQWTISNNQSAVLPVLNAALKEPTGWDAHLAWWKNYWSKSAVMVPDEQLQKQYYLEMYKFGCVARSNTPPISLQAIWTADNGNLPPWKGDYHHDLNTQLSYWPGYTGNHPDLTASYTNWLWKIKSVNKKWTKNYFGVQGLNVPGVTTISGKEMGGWIQYSMSPATAAWVAQHFYWQWKYTMDKNFFSTKAQPYFKEVEKFYSGMLKPADGNNKQLGFPLSSSPEYHDNSIKAWFTRFTNYDLALIKNFYKAAREIEKQTIESKDAHKLIRGEGLLPDYDINETGLTIAPGQNLDESHRHHAQLMAIYPLGLLSPGDNVQNDIIKKSLNWLAKKGTRNWCGYSFSWAACIYARAKEADSATGMLKIFATNFCSPNSFHLNGDQQGGQYSSFTYRPFTLEGNFAFAQGIHEMLIQSYNGYIEIFPAVPKVWKDVSFDHLRTEGAFLVSAKRGSGLTDEVRITATVAGELRLKMPFKTWIVKGIGRQQIHNNENSIASVILKKGQTIVFKNGYE